MDSSSDKLKRILNELAILNQPEQKNGMVSYPISELRKIKNLSAEAYILTDLCAKESSRHFQETVIKEVVNEDVPKMEKPPFAEDKTELVPKEPTDTPEVTPPPLEETPVKEPLPTEPINKPISDNQESNNRKNFSTMVSMTRRFEYINKLFKGDSDSYAKFVSNLENSNLTETLMAYENAYNQMEWNRQQESADEFKRLIIKYFE